MRKKMRISNKRKEKYHAREVTLGYLYILPSFIGVIIFLLIPFLDAVRRSFSEVMTRKLVGFANYEILFQNKAFLRATKNTLKFVGICIPLLLVLSLAISVMIFSIKRMQDFFKTTYLIPMVIPAASIVLLWRILFENTGLINKVMVHFHMQPIDWIHSGHAFFVLVFTYIWKNIGYDMILWLAGLNAIGQEMYEAAAIDGAGRMKQFIYITLPNLKSTTFIIVVLSIINSFKVFREVYLIGGNYPDESIYMLQHLFNNWFTALDIQKMCAAASIVAAILMVVILLLKLLLDRDSERE